MPSLQNQKQLSYKSYINTVKGLYDQPIARTSTALILTLITIAFFGLAAIRPTLGTVSELIGELEEKREIEKKMDLKIKHLTQAQEAYNQYRDELAIFDVAIPAEQEFETILLQIEYLAAANQTPLENMRVNTLVTQGSINEHYLDTDPFPSFSLNFTAEGEYEELKILLDKVNNLSRYLSIESVAFNQPEDIDVNPDNLKMNTTLRAYWAPDEANQQRKDR